MAKNKNTNKDKNKNKSFTGETSEIAKTETFEKLKALNLKLLKEVEECRQEIQLLRGQLAAATKNVDEAEMRMLAALKEKDEVEMQFIAAVKEKDENSAELADLKEKLRYLMNANESAGSEPESKKWRKWLYPAAAFLVGTTFMILGCRCTRFKN